MPTGPAPTTTTGLDTLNADMDLSVTVCNQTRELVINVADARTPARRTDARSRHARRPLRVASALVVAKAGLVPANAAAGGYQWSRKNTSRWLGGGLAGVLAP